MSIEDFLRNIRPFDESGTLQEFLRELRRVPDYEAKLTKLILENRTWLESAERTKDEDGYHVYFMMDRHKPLTFNSAPLDNEICLRNFEDNNAPTIKVITHTSIF